MSTTTTTTRTISYTKLRDGSWGLRGHGLADGVTVVVVKRDGTRKTETVGRVLWRGTDGLALATIAGASSAPRQGRRPFSTGARRYECPECGDYVTRGTTCWETGCRH